MATIRKAAKADVKAIGEFYASLSPNILIGEEIQLIAEENGLVVGIVRLVEEEGHFVLRGMNVRAGYRRQGIGKQLLLELQNHIGHCDCFCLPFAHLKDFYGSIGFKPIKVSQAPIHLAKRLETYISMGLEIIIMKRASGERLRN